LKVQTIDANNVQLLR